MLQFSADRFVTILLFFQRLEGWFKDIEEKKGIKTFPARGKEAQDFTKDIDSLLRQLDDIELKMSSVALKRIRDNLQTGAALKDIRTGLVDVRTRIQDELANVLLFCVPSDVSKYYAPKEPLFGQPVQERFTLASFEIDEAGKCLAFGRSTACVFHLMRVLDIGLTKLCEILNVQNPKANWGTVFKQLEEKIRAMPDTKNPEDEKTYYSAALAHLYNVKDAWRNHVSHGREKYTEEEALGIYNSVRSFMMGFAERLSK